MDTDEGIEDFVDYQVNAMMLVAIGVGMAVFSFVINDVLHSINNGGIFSFFTGVRSMQARAASVDIDFSSLRIVFVALCYLITTCIGILFGIVLSRRTIYVFIFSGLLGGVLLDDLAGARLIAIVAARQGYIRCTARDHIGGTGKGKVWFNDYVLGRSDCPSQ
jgi:hypothetical protein